MAMTATTDVEGRVREQGLERVEDSSGDGFPEGHREQGQVVLHPLAGGAHGLDDPRADVEVFRERRSPQHAPGELHHGQCQHQRAAQDEVPRPAGKPAVPGCPRFCPAAGGRGHPVQHDREQDNGEPGVDSRAHVERLQRPDHHLAKSGSCYQGRDGDHGQGRHGALVDSHDNGATGHGKLQGEQPLQARCTQRVGGFARVLRDGADAMRRQADNRRRCVDHRGDNGRSRADEEDQGQRGQVNECRQRLHEVQYRRDHLGNPAVDAGQDTEWDSDQEGKQHGGEDQGERVRGLDEQALEAKEDKDGNCQQCYPGVPDR